MNELAIMRFCWCLIGARIARNVLRQGLKFDPGFLDHARASQPWMSHGGAGRRSPMTASCRAGGGAGRCDYCFASQDRAHGQVEVRL